MINWMLELRINLEGFVVSVAFKSFIDIHVNLKFNEV